MSDDATFRNLIRLRNFLQSKGWDEDADVANKVAARIEALEARLGALCSYPLCDCKGSGCQVIDGPVPEVCARSDLEALKAENARLREFASELGCALDHVFQFSSIGRTNKWPEQNRAYGELIRRHRETLNRPQQPRESSLAPERTR